MTKRESDLLQELERLDTDGKFELFHMSTLDLETYGDFERVGFQGGKFKENSEYFYFFDGYIVSLDGGYLMDFLVSALEDLTDGNFLLEDFDKEDQPSEKELQAIEDAYNLLPDDLYYIEEEGEIK